MSNFEIWTDGGCAPQNPGIGGYGIIIVDNASKEERVIKQGFKRSTNNRMELRAVIRALNEIPKEASIKLYTDSEYVVKHVNGTYKKKSNNHDLWIRWVKGHKKAEKIKGILYVNNNRCDAMVHEARKEELIVDEGY